MICFIYTNTTHKCSDNRIKTWYKKSLGHFNFHKLFVYIHYHQPAQRFCSDSRSVQSPEISKLKVRFHQNFRLQRTVTSASHSVVREQLFFIENSLRKISCWCSLFFSRKYYSNIYASLLSCAHSTNFVNELQISTPPKNVKMEKLVFRIRLIIVSNPLNRKHIQGVNIGEYRILPENEEPFI